MLTFLGLELDTKRLEVHLPPTRLADLRVLVNSTSEASKLCKCELASLLGHLSFASKAVPAGRTFLWCLYDLDKANHSMGRYKTLCLSQIALEDLTWWNSILQTWPGKSFFLMEQWTPAPQLQLQTDASGEIGFGA